MSAPKENKYYQLRNRHGRKLSLTPDILCSKALKYFLYMNIPKYKMGIPVSTHYTLVGMLRFIGISKSTFHRYEKRKEFVRLCKELRIIIHSRVNISKIQKKLKAKD